MATASSKFTWCAARTSTTRSAGRLRLLPTSGAVIAISNLPQPSTRVNRGPMCEVCQALASLPADEAKALRGHLANPAWRYTELSDALAADNDSPLDLPSFVLSRHARGKCAAREKLR